MVSSNVIIAIILAMLFCFLFPIIVLIYFKIKEHFSIKTTLIGVLGFVLFSLVLEQMLHKLVIGNKLIAMDSIAFAIYGALAAGVFEECGRFIMFKLFLKKNREWKDGLGYAIGHGGIEAILIGGLSLLNSLIYALALKSGTLNVLLSGQSSSTIEAIKKSILSATAMGLGVSAFERVLAFTIQIALTFVVLYGIRERKNIYLLIAILLHGMVDFSAALYQIKMITNLYLVEGITLIFAVIGLVFIIKSKKLFQKSIEI